MIQMTIALDVKGRFLETVLDNYSRNRVKILTHSRLFLFFPPRPQTSRLFLLLCFVNYKAVLRKLIAIIVH